MGRILVSKIWDILISYIQIYICYSIFHCQPYSCYRKECRHDSPDTVNPFVAACYKSYTHHWRDTKLSHIKPPKICVVFVLDGYYHESKFTTLNLKWWGTEHVQNHRVALFDIDIKLTGSRNERSWWPRCRVRWGLGGGEAVLEFYI